MNGIIENYVDLRAELQDAGRGLHLATPTPRSSRTSSPAAYRGDLAAAVRAVLPAPRRPLRVRRRARRRARAPRRVPPRVPAGASASATGERFVASAIPAFLRETRDIDADRGRRGGRASRPTRTRVWNGARRDAGPPRRRGSTGTRTPPRRAATRPSCSRRSTSSRPPCWDTIGDRLRPDGSVDLVGLGLDDAALARVERIHIVACGTSYHAGLVGRYLIEDWARVPVHVEVASEYRYRTCLAGPGDLVIGITQSGETADTLAAMRVARERGAHVVALTNIMGSQATRDADGVLYTRAGLEIGVAATKTHTAQVMALSLLALKLGRLKWALTAAGAARPGRGAAPRPRRRRGLPRPRRRPADGRSRSASRYADRPFFLYLGRHVGVPVCFEGALKLKEISYIPTEAYPAGEMKHGPIALLEEGSPGGRAWPPTGTSSTRSCPTSRRSGPAARASSRSPPRATRRSRSHADDVLWAPRTPALLSPISRGRSRCSSSPTAIARARGPQRRPAAQPRQDRNRRVEVEGRADHRRRAST